MMGWLSDAKLADRLGLLCAGLNLGVAIDPKNTDSIYEDAATSAIGTV